MTDPYEGMKFRTGDTCKLKGRDVSVVEKMHDGQWVPWVGIADSSIPGITQGNPRYHMLFSSQV